MGKKDIQPGGRKTYLRLKSRENEIGGVNKTRILSFFFLSPTRVATWSMVTAVWLELPKNIVLGVFHFAESKRHSGDSPADRPRDFVLALL